MKTFTVHLQSPSLYERIESVTAFQGIDQSGSFGIWPGHERMMTVLTSGIAALKLNGQKPQYLGLAEGVLYYTNNELSISTRKYLRDSDYTNLAQVLKTTLQEEEANRLATRKNIRDMEEALLKQLLKLSGRNSL